MDDPDLSAPRRMGDGEEELEVFFCEHIQNLVL
jgi:hypothetical protein